MTARQSCSSEGMEREVGDGERAPDAQTGLLSSRLSEGKGCFALFVIMVSYFWWAPLWHAEVMVFGDAAHHGMSLLAFLRDGLLGERYLLWESGIYGGHPLLAESQGGFLNPINLICALLFSPEYGVGVLFWLNGVIAGAGIYLLARQLEISRWAALFSSISTYYAAVWLGFQYNTSVTATMAWIPWVFVAVEFWLNKPTLQRACLMAVPAALATFGGYPHLVYGAAIYLAAYGFGLLLRSDGRLLLRRHGWALLWQGSVALLLAFALAAVQLVPLVELVTQSHRHEGVGLFFGGHVPLVNYLRGVLFLDEAFPFSGSLASIPAALFAGIALVARPPARILAHALGAFVLLNLGMEFASPLFRTIYENGLLPGLDKFRIMHPFLVLAAIGFSLVAGYGLTVLSGKVGSARVFWGIGALLIAAAVYLHTPELGRSVLIAPAIIFVAVAALIAVRQNRWIPVVAVVGIAAEALVLRSHIYDFFDRSILEIPTTAQEILKDEEISRFKAADYMGYRTLLMGTFKPPGDPVHGPAYRQILESVSPFPSLRWGIPSIKGVLALALERRGMIETTLEAEITGELGVAPGKRLIDILGVKYISFHKMLDTPGFELISHHHDTGVLLYRNNAALPSIRTYSAAMSVESPRQALEAIRDGKGDRLVIEGAELTSEPCSGAEAQQEIITANSSRYVVQISTECPVWLFIADAYYPGWSATVDGQRAELVPAQVLGKAVAVPPGEHSVEIRFTPWSFYIGAAISLAGLMFLLLVLLRKRVDE